MTLREKVKHSVQFPFFPALLALCWGALKKRKILYVKPLKSKDCGKSLILRIISVARVLVGQGLQSKHVHAQKVLASFRRAA